MHALDVKTAVVSNEPEPTWDQSEVASAGVVGPWPRRDPLQHRAPRSGGAPLHSRPLYSS